MRHVSRTHRVYLDWFFDRINFEREPSQKIREHRPTDCGCVDQGLVFARALDAIDTLFWCNDASNALLQPLFGIYLVSTGTCRSDQEICPVEQVSAKITANTFFM